MGKIEILESALARQTQELDALKDKQRDTLEAAKARGLRGNILTELESQHAQHVNLAEWAIGQTREELADLRNKAASEQARAAELRAASEAAQKTLAAQEWERVGGNLADFESAWPAIRLQILQQSVLSALASPGIAQDDRRAQYADFM